MKLVRGALVSLILVVGCSKKTEAPAAGSGSAPGSGSAIAVGSGSAAPLGSGSGSGSGSDAGSAGSAGSGSAAAAAPLPSVKGDKQGFLLADKPGGTVEVDFEGKKSPVADGTLVELVHADQESDHSETTIITVGGKRGKIATRHLVLEEYIQAAPKGDYALVAPQDSCGDFCHHAVWLVRGLAERWRVYDTAVRPNAAWHPSGTLVAIGGDGQLVVHELPSGKQISKTDKFFAPAYAPDGTLYVRASDFGVYTLGTDGKSKKVSKGKKLVREEGEDFEPVPGPVSFKPDGKFEIDDI